jgi:uroporphyrin-III C-methyltransferase
MNSPIHPLNLKKPQLTLVGAGPGDAELITLKGMKALQKAAIVLYDALANPELLDFAPKTALKISVGKRAGKHSHTQTEINQLIVKYAFQYGSVVRLKGGDPFIFGRAQEEIEYAETFGIEVMVIPGISSAMGLPVLQKIPLTQRGVSESFWVITGTTQDRKLSEDLALAAQTTATVVVLMGVKQLPEIVAQYQILGRGNLPIALIQNGSTPQEKTAIAEIDNILEEVNRKGIGSPAVIIIGEVVREKLSQVRILNEQFSMMNEYIQ